MRSIITMAALVAAAVPLAPAAAQSMQGYTAGPTRLYSGPLRAYPSVRTIRGGTRVSVHGCLRDWSWCDVTYRTDRGWIAGNALRIRQNGRRHGLAADMGIGVTTFSFGAYWDNHYQGRTFYGQRQRWQSQYDRAYRPEWGDREQRPGEDTQRNRGRTPDRNHSEGVDGEGRQGGGNRDENQRGQDLRGKDLHGDNRKAQEQHRRAQEPGQRKDDPATPHYTGEPYQFPDHATLTAQPEPGDPRPATQETNTNSGRVHPVRGEAQTDSARHPQY